MPNVYNPGRIDIAVVSDGRRGLLVTAPPAVLDETCYLWRNFSVTAGGARINEYEMYVPFAEGRYGVYTFKDYIGTSGGTIYFGRMKEGVPVVNVLAASLTKVGTWAAGGNLNAYGGTAQQSSTAGDTITGSVTGHTIILRTFMGSNEGFALVSIDGDFTLANRCPIVAQADVDAGYFVSGDLGKRYVETYSNLSYEDEHVVLAEGLNDAAHTVQLVVKGTKRAASSAARVYVSAFAGATAGTKVTDANASMGYVRDVTNIRSGNTFSKMSIVPEYTPAGFTNYQFLGGNHGNETLVSQQFLVDGVVSAPAAGVYVAGSVIKSELVSSLTHPDTGATVVAAKRSNYVARADRPAQLSCRYQIQYKNAGTNRGGYFGMLHLGTRQYPVSVTENVNFPRVVLGDRVLPSLGANDDSVPATVKADYAAAYSSAHDTVAVVHVPRLDLNVDSFQRAGSGVFVQDRTDGTEKIYFARSTSTGLETLVPGTVHSGEIQWRVIRIPRAQATLEGVFY